jgi:hypothetical protein
MKKIALLPALLVLLVATPAFADPVISGISDMTVEATGHSGAIVNFTPIVTDATDSTDPMVCTPASGSIFALGATTTVSCTSSDSLFATSTVTFDVGVIDTTAPVFTSLPNHIFVATSSFSIMPQSAYPTATDTVDPHPVITYAPTSLSTGANTVTWTATDASGNSVATTSQVTIVAPIEVDVPANCSVTDTTSTVHAYPSSGSSNLHPGICVLEAAKEAGLVSSFTAEDFSFGLFVASIDGDGNDTNPSWTLWDNEVSSSVGITDVALSPGDIVSFVLTDFSNYPSFTESEAVALQVHSLVPANSGGGGGGGGGPSHGTFNMQNALVYIASKQNNDGSFGSSSSITDWTAVAFGAVDPGPAKTKLKTYLLGASPALVSATDYERHAMALEALGINPYSGTATNYIASIIAKFDGTQIGDPNLDNDDIFAILALTHAGYSASDPIIQKEVTFLRSKQNPDGSWDENADLTGAAIEALGPLLTDPQSAGQVLGGAAGYLVSTQQSNGGWGNVDSTSWVQTAINGIIAAHTPGFSTESAWAARSGSYPTDALANAQQIDGAVQPSSASADTRVWSTSYAIVAASGKDWNTILQSFAQPSTIGGGGGGTSASSNATSTVSATSSSATSTPATATSTPDTAATSTTPSITPTIASTSPENASTTPAAPKPVKKKIVAVHATVAATTTVKNPTAPEHASQTASVGATHPQSAGVLGNVWHAVVGFFSHWF